MTRVTTFKLNDDGDDDNDDDNNNNNNNNNKLKEFMKLKLPHYGKNKCETTEIFITNRTS
jgi:hypothetical protein